ncbi:zinc finger CCHC domain-containing protein 7 isoform X1 [Tenrec ecaudatus]|uniref:zinc finger CCHC domain-containing protein 7 isoform X1 n=1 Tax=Tenrec ecaudatus TaxID=94439 RepID=UPI003F5AAE0A
MMFGGFETIEAYEDDIYCEESSSESADSEVEFHLYSQVHYAQDLDNVREEKHEEMDSENSELLRRKPLQQNLIVVSDSEVIQLSDESEVITLSDEESIYRCKRKNTDTQSQEETRGAPASLYSKELAEKTCKRDIEKPQSEKRPGVLHEVMIIEVSSSEEEDSSASESDNVESWMLLGCEVDDDKDDDILLNLVGCDSSVHEAEDGVNWFIGDKDVEAQICNNRSSGRWAQRYYSANKNVTCRNCDKCGHLSKNCPRPQKVRSCCLCSERGHLQYACPARYCLDCSLPMSTSHRCFERSSWRKRCARCDMIGHYADACPEIWRQYHLTTTPGPPKKPKTPSRQSALVYCYNCAQKGHYGHECTEERMFNQTFATSPFVYYYDDKSEIQERERRLQRKVRELQKNGDFPRQFKRAHVEEDKKAHHTVREGHGSWKKSRWPQEKKEMQRDAVGSRSRRERERRRKADRWHEEDEDFPRGPRLHQKRPKSLLRSGQGHRSREEQPSKEAKRGKQKKERGLGDDDDDDLFLIKQRKKKT